ncbi:hypothetical protein M5Z67_07125 [Neisseria meningitidis]|nr:hypothetical protein [Neisseria meningitidis]
MWTGFFQNQALAFQRKGIKTAVLAPMFRYLRKETASILTDPYGFAKYSGLNLNQYSVASPCRTICTVCGFVALS